MSPEYLLCETDAMIREIGGAVNNALTVHLIKENQIADNK
jgi:hypothetical protein